MREMSPEERRGFLLAGTRTAKLSTVRPDGRPHVAPVWFLLDGEAVVFTTHESTVKARNMRRNPRVSLCVDDERPPYSFVLVEGTARLSAGDPELLDWTTRIGGRYMGQERAEEYGRRNAAPGELLVRVEPVRVVARAGVAE
ncbi:pyridoxamine 5'-phosphate oxidase-related, FMN-binding protein [Rubrobacter xylanophilus DSM 9941]|uniref:Pyridoxamine 5'-phosphate oxidase-related, FMN-binding protein n=1 Tax=Rubrobacter xylanophilus (strain DSM 9941 / JCM 11954 / NBRC 16129 / PRD-1) TaxID=266117 RepID=Q1AWS8_RUBXD|nr:PPOX class F420-dependent oxidoreductase [Rubrobacter xylanophilus]ABG04150.1 pyridoxamine 5'-phosphate oxidase-related, FMN-binding protein [Rubrobacter xylanophilus DSM 9941]